MTKIIKSSLKLVELEEVTTTFCPKCNNPMFIRQDIDFEFKMLYMCHHCNSVYEVIYD